MRPKVSLLLALGILMLTIGVTGITVHVLKLKTIRKDGDDPKGKF